MTASPRQGDDAVKQATEFARETEAVRAELENAVVNAGLSEDALGSVLRALSSALRIIAAAPGVILAAQQPAALSPENQRELVSSASRDVAHGVHLTIADTLRWVRPASLISACWITVAVALGVFFLGRWSVDTTLRVRMLEGASFAAQVAALNDDVALRDYCLSHITAQGPDGAACALPVVWITPPDRPATPASAEPVKAAGRRR